MLAQKPKHQHTMQRVNNKTSVRGIPAYFLVWVCTDEKCKYRETYDLVYELPS